MNQINLSEEFNADEIKVVQLFNMHFKEIWNNYDDLQRLGLDLSADFSCGCDGRIHGGGLSISRHRLKGFFLDYRLFHQQGEPIQFHKVCKLLKRRCRDHGLRVVLDRQRCEWDAPSIPVVGWHNKFTVTDVVEVYFNEELFHLGEAKGSGFRMSDIRKKMTDDALLYATVLIVYKRLMVLRNVNWLLEPVLKGQPFLRLPDN